DGKSAIFSNTTSWHWFIPPKPEKWADYEPQEGDLRSTLGNPNYLRIEDAAGWGAEPLWGPDHTIIYLRHVVSERDLAEIRAPAQRVDRKESLVPGQLHVAADDACDVMLNGVPLLHARSQAERAA